MNVKSDGSVIILVLVITTSLTIIMVTAIKAAIIFYNLALERTEYVRQTRAVESLAHYGIALGQSHHHHIVHQVEFHQTFDAWPLKKGYKGTVTVVLQPAEYTVHAQLVTKNNTIRSIESTVIREKERWWIANWIVA